MARARDFRPHFDGTQMLDELLSLAGSPFDSAAVMEQMRQALRRGEEAKDVIPTLFAEEPRFPDPSYARRLFENLFGLWEIAREGGPLPQGPRPARERKRKAGAPPPFKGEPDAAFVEAAWRHLEDDERARERLFHAFENRQDALLARLDEVTLSDDGYGVLRLLLSELSGMIELGTQAPLKAAELPEEDSPEVPEALWAYAEEAIFEAEQDEESPLPKEEADTVRRWARRALAALWRARSREGA